MADHGDAFTPGGYLREPSGDNHDEIFRVPMIIKAPGQSVGEIDDRPAQTVDLLPTLVDLLGVQTDWTFDGVALRPSGPRPDPVVVLPTADAPRPFTREVDPLFALARRTARRFPEEGGWRGVFAAGRLGPHVGSEVSALPQVDGPSPFAWSTPDLAALRTVDRDGTYLPVQVSGTLSATDGSVPPDQVLLALNGTVAGVGDVTTYGAGGWRFLALLDPARFRDGANDLSVHVPDSTGEHFGRARPAHPSHVRLERGTVVVDGVELALARPDAVERLEVDRAFTDDVSITIEGLAVSSSQTLPTDVVLFVDDRPVSTGADPYPVLNLGGEELDLWGFLLQVPRDAVADAATGTLVAIYADHAVGVPVAWG